MISRSHHTTRDRLTVLLVGSGGREHVLAWALGRSPLLGELLIAPGNAGTAALGENAAVAAEDVPGLVELAQRRSAGLVIVGPEAPLGDGLADALDAAGVPVFGPTRAAARIESSKEWARGLMARHGIPSPGFAAFSDVDDALAYLDGLPDGPLVVKADGLAAGKGVIMAGSREEARRAVTGMMREGAFGEAGSTVVIEERLVGPEVSVFAFADGATVSTEIAACDYKRAYDGNAGPNTGGMGAYTPPEFWTPALASRVRREIMEPAAAGMVAEGCAYRGMLYGGLMLTADGPKVIEFNCRFGDPEAQVVLPQLESDLLEVALAVAEGRLEGADVRWRSGVAVGVVMASGGYPGGYETGKAIGGLDDLPPDALVFHAGTSRAESGDTLTAGGRVLAAVGRAGNYKDARDAAYEIVDRISFENAEYRTDIAARAIAATILRF